jgi:hypothetical protein
MLPLYPDVTKDFTGISETMIANLYGGPPWAAQGI